jgi:hypothetical protein
VIHSWGLARDLLQWWHNYFTFRSADGSALFIKTVFDQLFSLHARALVVYKRVAESQGDNDHCTAAQVERWITRFHGSCLDGLSGIPDNWSSMTFDWSGEQYSVQLTQAHQTYHISMCFFSNCTSSMLLNKRMQSMRLKSWKWVLWRIHYS